MFGADEGVAQQPEQRISGQEPAASAGQPGRHRPGKAGDRPGGGNDGDLSPAAPVQARQTGVGAVDGVPQHLQQPVVPAPGGVAGVSGYPVAVHVRVQDGVDERENLWGHPPQMTGPVRTLIHRQPDPCLQPSALLRCQLRADRGSSNPQLTGERVRVARERDVADRRHRVGDSPLSQPAHPVDHGRAVPSGDPARDEQLAHRLQVPGQPTGKSYTRAGRPHRAARRSSNDRSRRPVANTRERSRIVDGGNLSQGQALEPGRRPQQRRADEWVAGCPARGQPIQCVVQLAG